MWLSELNGGYQPISVIQFSKNPYENKREINTTAADPELSKSTYRPLEAADFESA